MAGMNDAIRGFDPERIRQLWSEMCKEPSLVVTLVPPTKHDEINRKIEQINNIILEACQGMPVIRLNLADDSGRIKPEYASDGVHIGPKGYEKWIAELRR
jgi:lysophospholipase L1-like esterase